MKNARPKYEGLAIALGFLATAVLLAVIGWKIPAIAAAIIGVIGTLIEISRLRGDK